MKTGKGRGFGVWLAQQGVVFTRWMMVATLTLSVFVAMAQQNYTLSTLATTPWRPSPGPIIDFDVEDGTVFTVTSSPFDGSLYHPTTTLFTFDTTAVAQFPRPLITNALLSPKAGGAISARSNFVYAAINATLFVVDRTDPLNSALVLTTNFPAGLCKFIKNNDSLFAVGGGSLYEMQGNPALPPKPIAFPHPVGGGYGKGVCFAGADTVVVCLPSESGFEIWNVADRSAPRLLSAVTSVRAVDVTVSGNTAYIFGGIVRSYDISSPSNPRLLQETLNYGDGDPMLIVSTDEQVFTLGRYGQLRTFGVNTNRTLTNLGSVGVQYFNDPDYRQVRMRAIGSQLYISSPSDGLHVWETRAGQMPTFVNHLTTEQGMSSITATQTNAYVCAGGAGLLVYDVSAAPIALLSETPTIGPARAVTVVDHRAYVAANFGGLDILDVTDAQHPFRLATYKTEDRCVAVEVVRTNAYVAHASGVDILNVSDPASPQLLANIRGTNVQSIAVTDGYLVVNGYSLSLFDVNAPAHPLAVTNFAGIIPPNTISICANKKVAYFGDGGRLDFRDTSHVQNNAGTSTFANQYACFVADDYLFTVRSFFSLRIDDVSVAVRPVASVPLPKGVLAFTVVPERRSSAPGVWEDVHHIYAIVAGGITELRGQAPNIRIIDPPDREVVVTGDPVRVRWRSEGTTNNVWQVLAADSENVRQLDGTIVEETPGVWRFDGLLSEALRTDLLGTLNIVDLTTQTTNQARVSIDGIPKVNIGSYDGRVVLDWLQFVRGVEVIARDSINGSEQVVYTSPPSLYNSINYWESPTNTTRFFLLRRLEP